jgi:hypothetical protein
MSNLHQEFSQTVRDSASIALSNLAAEREYDSRRLLEAYKRIQELELQCSNLRARIDVLCEIRP